MAQTYEYASATYGVGLEGLPVSDEEALNAVADDGWEPMLMTSVHNGFAVLILFRRLMGSGPARKKATVPTRKAAGATKKTAGRAATGARTSGGSRTGTR